MTYQTLISADELAAHLGDPEWAIVDCRFLLGEADAGRRRYLRGHIPGAVFADLEKDLSAPVIPGKTGRHPLPTVDEAAALFSRLGIDGGVQVVAYDDLGGAIAAARCWWMLRWLGHPSAAVLDGGWQAWLKAGLPVTAGEEFRPSRQFIPQPVSDLAITAENVARIRLDPGWRLLDSRAAERYRGENETIDPVAGHIPGAVSAPYAENLDAEGFFLPPEALRQRFKWLVGDAPANQVVFYCGSGVSAIHNILAMLHAGLGEARLYPGSWSEWITDARRPAAKGQ